MEKENHINNTVSGLVMLAAVFTTLTTYSYYKDDVLASNYENEAASLDQTASALVSLRMMETVSSTTPATTTEDVKIETEVELQ